MQTRTSSRFHRFHDSRHIAALAWPILIGQLAVIANGVIDTAMVSRFSATDLAALAIGSSIYVSVFVGLHGVLQALAPHVGQLFGAERYADIGAEVKQGAWLAVFLSILGGIALLFPQPLLSLAHASPQLAEKCELYLYWLSLSLPASLGFRIYAAFNTAIGRPKMVMALQLASLVLKVPLNAWFIFGGFGLPAFGGPGCAIATTVISWLLLLIGFAILRMDRSYRVYAIFHSGFVWPSRTAQFSLLKLGVPMGLSYLIEVTAFAFMSIFITRLGEIAVAGHQIVANFGAVLYMLPLSIASAVGTLVAQAVGARDQETAHRITFAGIRLAVVSSVTIGCFVWLARHWIARAYTPDAGIIAAAEPLFFFIAFYQLFDSIQVTAAFVLRAYKIAVVPTVMYAVSLWGVGLGGGYLLGLNPYGFSPALLQGAAGFWFGNSVSLGVVAGLLLLYLRIVQRDAMRA